MSAQAAAEHTCHGAIFCGQPRAAAERECPACPTGPSCGTCGQRLGRTSLADHYAADHPRRREARPLQEVLDEHCAQVAADREAARRQALQQLAEHALPADAPGAWIRAAIAELLEADR